MALATPYNYGGTCPRCMHGREWVSPSGESIRLCDEHESIVTEDDRRVRSAFGPRWELASSGVGLTVLDGSE